MNKTPESQATLEARLHQATFRLEPEAFDAFETALATAPLVKDNPKLMALLRRHKPWREVE